ncbi:hypothetical protein V3390_00305 [Luteimonas sp. FXH3W]|uniref:Uncharacterized protein n=1 Tax=Aquilutibacter rugosus TaxID=3115820 RepID=A0ABU7UVX9_9GAMM
MTMELDRPVSLSAAEFTRRVTAGEPVSGCMVTEPAYLHGQVDAPMLLRTTDWNRCVFLHGLRLTHVQADADGILATTVDERLPNELTLLNLHGIQCHGDLAIDGLYLHDPQQRLRQSQLTLRISGSRITGSLGVERLLRDSSNVPFAAALNVHRSMIDGDFGVWLSGPVDLHIDGEASRIEGSVELTEGLGGQISRASFQAARISGGMRLNVSSEEPCKLFLRGIHLGGPLRGDGTFAFVSASYSRFDSEVAIRHQCAPGSADAAPIFMDFTESVLGAALRLKADAPQRVTYHLSLARITGSVVLAGRMHGEDDKPSVSAIGASIGGNLELAFAPSPVRADQRGRRIEAATIEVGGDVSFSISEDRDGNTDASSYALELYFWSAKIGGEFRLRGDEILDAGNAAGRFEVRCLVLDGAIVRGYIGIGRVDLTATCGWSTGTSCINLRHAQAPEIVVRDVRIRLGGSEGAVWIDGEQELKPLAGRSDALNPFAVIDARFAKISMSLRIGDLRGSFRTPHAMAFKVPVAVRLSGAKCGDVDLDGIFVEANDTYLPIVATDLEVAGTFDWRPGEDTNRDQTSLPRVPSLDLNSAQIVCLRLTDPPPPKLIDLRGAQVTRWRVADSLQPEVESAPVYLRLLRTLREFDSSVYSAVETRLADIGKKADADAIFIERRKLEQERDRQDGNYLRWLGSWLHGITVGYGTKPFVRPGLALALIFVVAVALSYVNYGQWFRQSTASLGAMQECGAPCEERLAASQEQFHRMKAHAPGTAGKRLADAAGFVTRNVVPLVDLQVGAGIEPISGSGAGILSLLLKLCGWALWPILISSFVVTILHSRHRG